MQRVVESWEAGAAALAAVSQLPFGDLQSLLAGMDASSLSGDFKRCLGLLSIGTAHPHLRQRCIRLASTALVSCCCTVETSDSDRCSIELASLTLAALAPDQAVIPGGIKPAVAACIEGFCHRFTEHEWSELCATNPDVEAYRNAARFGLSLGQVSSPQLDSVSVIKGIISDADGKGNNAALSISPSPGEASATVSSRGADCVDVAGLTLRKRQGLQATPSPTSSEDSFRLVLTSTTQSNLRRLARALSICAGSPDRMPPLLLEGPAGAGKTVTIRHVAALLGYSSDIIELHLDDVTDGRTLLGSYVCTDVPGEFRWQPGAITQAVTTGRWVVIEDIDRAPFEVLAALAPLFADRRLVLPGKHEPIKAHPDFVLFATRSTAAAAAAASSTAHASTSSSSLSGGSLGAAAGDDDADYHSVLLSAGSTGTVTGPLGAFLHHWLRIPIQPLSTSLDASSPASGSGAGSLIPSSSSAGGGGELSLVLQTQHPRLPPSVIHGMLLSFQLLQLAHGASPPAGASSMLAQLLRLLPSAVRSLAQFGRSLSPRDLLKWACRIEGLTDVAERAEAQTIAASSGIASSSADIFLPDRTKEAILAEAIAVFGGHLPQSSLRISLGRALAAVWGLSDDAADQIVRTAKPDIELLPSGDSSTSSSSSSSGYLRVGRVSLPVMPGRQSASSPSSSGSVLPRGFAPTRHGLQLLERVAAAVAMREAVLLVGETGNGKTSAVQVLADVSGARLVVINLNMQTDSSDLLGGYKPVHMKQLATPLVSTFTLLFKRTFSEAANESFITAVEVAAAKGDWAKLSKGVTKAVHMAMAKLTKAGAATGTAASVQLSADWSGLSKQLAAFDRQRAAIEEAASASSSSGSKDASSSRAAAFAFQFVEGALVTAVRQGYWVLLDEINLASPETLQRLAGLLEGGGITLTEKGDADRVPPHPAFRLFSAMNPATDVGKRDLPPALRSRFSEVYVDDVEDRDDLAAVVAGCLAHIDGAGNNARLVGTVVDFYLIARSLSAPRTGILRDGGGGRPHYSLRSLTRALRITGDLMSAGYPLDYALHESIATSFLLQLDEASAKTLGAEIHKAFPVAHAGGSAAASASGTEPTAAAPVQSKKRKKGASSFDTPDVTSAAAPSSSQVAVRGSAASRDPSTHVLVGHCWLRKGPREPEDLAQPHPDTGAVRYVLVPSVKRHIHSLARAVVSGRFPVLLQGPTSSGKTSMVEYLAHLTGHECVRINNHEHTDLAEYLGTYVSDPSGRLVYTDGLLVTALRKGQWIILDELNLAPSEVLEALNRLLDDNREVFIPETQEIVRPHPSFMLFATQNPAGLYGGRKQLSLAFRNRFIEMHVEDMPDKELELILTRRSQLPPGFVEAMVGAMTELRRVRASSNVFAGKHGFVTTRDLLRWASRRPDSYQSLAEEGYTLLAERLRLPEEKATVQAVLERFCKAAIDPEELYARCCPSIGGGAGDETLSTAAATGATSAAAEAAIEPPARKRARLRNSLIPDLPSADGGAAASSSASPPGAPFHRLTSAQFQTVTTDRMGRLVRKLVKGRNAPSSASSAAALNDEDGDEEDGVDLTPGCIPGTEGLSVVSLTRSLQRMFTLLGRCIANDEPVLLVGDTGCGKTTVIQIFALLLQIPLHIVNCHAHTETADFLGSLRPVRAKAAHLKRFHEAAAQFASLLPDHTRKALLGLQQQPEGGGDSADVSMSGSSANDDIASAIAELQPEELSHRLTLLAQPSAGGSPLAGLTSGMEPATAAALTSAYVDAVSAFTSWAALFEWVDGPLVTSMREGHFFLLDEASLAEDAVLERLNSVLEPSRTLTLAEKGEITASDSAAPSSSGQQQSSLNSSSLVIKGAPGFRFFATMNPGGDFGKRELSPALRNRFTEVWVPGITDERDLLRIVGDKAAAIALSPRRRISTSPLESALSAVASSSTALSAFVRPLVQFVRWFDDHASSGRLVIDDETAVTAAPPAGSPTSSSLTAAAANGHDARQRVLAVTLRDLHAWLEFMAAVAPPSSAITDVGGEADVTSPSAVPSAELWEAYAHGACLVLLDGLGLGTGLPPHSCAAIRAGAAVFLTRQAPPALQSRVRAVLAAHPADSSPPGVDGQRAAFGAPPFTIPLGPHPPRDTKGSYSLEAPTTRLNLYRLLRALQLPKPVLLEGSPGVGKSSLIEALARASGHTLVRINLSEQTDLADLFGQDLPASAKSSASAGPEGGSDGSRFAWSGGVFLKALKAGHWVLLDELNLATQTVLEGLNAVLDHRASVYIPELGRSFACPPSFRVFATQNPVGQGGGRKGLPKSFLNRFTKAYVEPLGREDQWVIVRSLFPQLDVPLSHVYPEMVTSASSSSSSSVSLLEAMITFNDCMHRDTMGGVKLQPSGDGGSSDDEVPESIVPLYASEGRPWEFNLRDLFRWCALVVESGCALEHDTRSQLDDLLHTRLPRPLDPSHGLQTVYLCRLRSPVDRAAALSRFVATFASAGVPLPPLAQQLEVHDAPLLRINESHFAIDDICLSRSQAPGVWRPQTEGSAVINNSSILRPLAQAVSELLANPSSPSISPPSASDGHISSLAAAHCTLRQAYHLASCVQHAWPALLVGPASAGKTASVRSLAALAGAPLREINVTPSTDATELLGCFEQVDPIRTRTRAAEPVLALLRAVAASATRLLTAASSTSTASSGAVTITSALSALHSATDALTSAVSSEQADHSPAVVAIGSALDTAASVASFCVTSVGAAGEPASLASDLTSALSFLRDWSLSQLTGPDAVPVGHFEWVDGVLVRALERGEWLLVDNVNFCSPAVIDRLNALLEPGGSLLVSECGIGPDGKPRVITAHPAFRVFFCMNPHLGDVSRALRNRCVELWYPPLQPSSDVSGSGGDGEVARIEFSRAADAICRVNPPGGGDNDDLFSQLRAAADAIYHRLSTDASTSADMRSIVSACGVKTPSVCQSIVALHDRCASAIATREGRLFGASPPSLSHLRRLADVIVAVSRLGPLTHDDVQQTFRSVYAHCGGSLADASAHSTASVIVARPVPSLTSVDESSLSFTSSSVVATVVAELCGLPTLSALISGRKQATFDDTAALESSLLLRASTFSGSDAALRASLLSSALAIHQRPQLPSIASASSPLLTQLCRDLSLSNELAGLLARSMPPGYFAALALTAAQHLLQSRLRLLQASEEHHLAQASDVIKSSVMSAARSVTASILTTAAIATQALSPPGVGSRAATEALGSLHPALAPLYAALTHLRSGLLSAFEAVCPVPAALLRSARECTRIAYRISEEMTASTIVIPLSAGAGAAASTSAGPSTDLQAVERSLERMVVLYRQLLKALHTGWEQLRQLASSAATHVAQQLALTEALISGTDVTTASPSSSSSSSSSLVIPQRVKDTLWKRGGHPLMPSTQAMAAARRSIRAAVAALQDRAASGDLPLVSLRHRRVLLDAIATFTWAVTSAIEDPAKATTSDATVAALANTLRTELADVIGPCTDAITSDESGSSMAVDGAGAAGDDVEGYNDLGESAEVEARRLLADIGVASSAMATRRKQALTLASTLVECWCLSDERAIMAVIWESYAVALLHTSSAGESTVAAAVQSITALLPRLQSWLAIALAGTNWSVEDLQPHQSLLWACEAVAAAAADSDSDAADVMSALVSVMRSSHSSLQVSWHMRLGAVKPASSGAEQHSGLPSGCVSFERLLHVQQVAAAFSILVPSSASSAAAPSSRALRNSPDSLLSFEGNVYRVLMTAGHLAARGFLQSSAALSSPAISALAQQEATILQSSLVATVAPFAPLTDEPAAAHVVLRAWHTGSASSIKWPSASHDARFQRLLQGGKLHSAAAAVAALSSVRIGDSAAASGAVASAWYHVSRLRLALITPSSPVDPSAAPRVKGELAAKERRLASDELSILLSSTGPLRGYGNDTSQSALPPVHALQQRLSSLDSTIHRLGRRVIVREASGDDASLSGPARTFHGWYRELHGFIRALVGDGSLEGTVALLLSVSTSPSSNASCSEAVSDAFRRVTMWEATAYEFCSRALREYCSFPDVTNPVMEPLLDLRYALAFARAHAGRVLAASATAPSTAIVVSPPKRALSASFGSMAQADQALLTAVASGASLSPASSATFRLLLTSAVLGRITCPTSSGLASLSQLVAAAAQYALAQENGAAAQAAAAASAGGVHTHLDADEEAKKEAAFRAEFPDFFAEHFAHLLPKQDTLGPDPAAAAAKAKAAAAAAAAAVSIRRGPAVADVIDPLQLAFSFLAGVHSSAKLAGAEGEGTDSLWASIARTSDEAFTASLPEQMAGLRSDHDVIGAEMEDLASLSTSVTSLSLGKLSNLLSPPIKVEPAPAAMKGASGTLPPLGKRVYNFFRDPNVGEASVAIRPVRALAARVASLLAQFPRNEVLLLILRLVHGVMRLPVHTPIAGMLSGVTLLYAKCHEWEANAASYVSLGPELKALGALITRWRRLELQCWRYLLQVAAQEDERIASELWLRLYGFIINGASSVKTGAVAEAVASAVSWALPGGTTSSTTTATASCSAEPSAADITTLAGFAKAVFETADKFVRSSTLGQLRVRLALLEASAADLRTRGCAALLEAGSDCDVSAPSVLLHLSSVLAGVHSHYAQYRDALSRALDAASGPVLKDISDQVLLHRWDEQSFYALQETAEKGHRLVHKATNRYREVLATPIAPILDMGYSVQPPAAPPSLPDAERGGEKAAQAILAEAGKVSSAPVAPVPSSSSSSTFTARLPSLSHRAAQLLATRSAGGLLAGPARAYRASAVTDALEAAGGLTRAWETIKDPEAWKTSKRAVLVDMLRGLGRQGFSPLSTAVPPQARETHTLLQLPHAPSVMSAAACFPEQASLLAAADVDFHRTLDRLIRIRALIASGGVHEDIAQHEHRRIAGYGDHILFTLAQQRTTLGPHARALEAVAAALATTSTSSPIASTSSLLTSGRAMLETLTSARAALDTGRASLLRGRQLIKGAAQVLTGSQPAGVDAGSEAVVIGVTNTVPQVDEASAPSGFDSAAVTAALGARLKHLNSLADHLSSLSSSLAAASAPLAELITQAEDDATAVRGILPSAPLILRSPSALQSALEGAAAALNTAHSALPSSGDTAPSSVSDDLPPLLSGYESGVMHAVRQTWPQAIAVDSAAAEVADVAMTSPAGTSAEPLVFESLIQEVMLAVQELVKVTAEADADTASSSSAVADAIDDDEGINVPAPAMPALAAADSGADDASSVEATGIVLHAAHKRYLRTFQAFRLPRLLAAATAAMNVAASPPPPHLQAMLRSLCTALRALQTDFLSFHRACACYGVHASVTFLNLLSKGLCVPPKKDDEGKGGEAGKGAGEGAGGKSQDLSEGTGIGQGQGAKDVSDQLTNEEQILGLKGEEQQQQPPAGPDQENGAGKDGDDGGVEMDADFEGALEDMPGQKQQQQGKDEEQEDQGPEEDMAREMGSVGPDDEQAEVVDERLWNDEDDQEEQPDKKAKSSKAAPQGQQKQEKSDALRAKEGESAEAGGKQQQEEEGEDAVGAPPDQQLAEGGGDDDAKSEEGGDDKDASAAEKDAGAADAAPDAGADGDDASADDDAASGDGSDADGKDEDEDKAERLDVAPRASDKALADEEQQLPQEDEEGVEGEQQDKQQPGDASEEADLQLDMDKQMQLDSENDEEQQQQEGEEDCASVDDDADNDQQQLAPEDVDHQQQAEQDGSAEDDTKTGAAVDQPEEVLPEGAPEEQAPVPAGAQDGETSQQPSEFPEGTASASGTEEVKAKPGEKAPQSQQQQQKRNKSKAPSSADADQDKQQGQDGGGGDDDDVLDGAASDTGSDAAGEALLPDRQQQPQTDANGEGVDGESEQQQQQQQQQPPPSAAPQPKPRSSRDANPFLDPDRAMRRWQARLVEEEDEDANDAPKPAASGSADSEQPDNSPPPPSPGDNNDDSAADRRPSAPAQQSSDVRLDDGGGKSMLLPVDDVMPLGRKEKAEDGAEDEAANAFPEEEAADEDGQQQSPGTAPVDSATMEVDEEGGDGDGDSGRENTGRHAAADDGSDGITPPEEEAAPEAAPAESVLRDILQPASKQQQAASNPDTAVVVRTGTDSDVSRPHRLPSFDDTAEALQRDDEAAAASALAPKDAAALRAEFERMLLQLRGASGTGSGASLLDTATQAWGALASLTAEPSARLCERLRLILEPTLASKLGGEYRSGKRINMRKVIPYIASQFRKDKIWMRRTTPSKRTYQVVVAVDDSRSMAPGNTGGGALACEAVALLCKALSRLEVGEIGIVSFGEEVRLLQPLDQPFTDEAGARALSQFTFAQETTRVAHALESIVGMLDASRSSSAALRSSSATGATQCMQLVFFISDGMLGSGAERQKVRRWITEATAKGQLVVLLVVDRAGANGSSTASAPASSSSSSSSSSSAIKPAEDSILSMQSISFVGGRVVKSSYLDDFPFPYYLVMRDVHALPDILSESLRQWFEMVARSGAPGK